MSNEKENTPAATSCNYDIMLPRWQKMNAVLGGTETMREAGAAFLPPHSEESDKAYKERLERAVFFNATSLTLDSWVGRPFGDPVMLSEDMPENVQTMMEDVDLQGNNLDVFCRHWFRQGMAKAFAHVIVDFPTTNRPKEDGQPRTLADDRKENIRPYWVYIPPENVIYMESEVRQGKEVLTHVRILQTVQERDGFIETFKMQILVYEIGKVTTYQLKEKDKESDKDEWEIVDELPISLDVIPMVTFYADREALALGKSPLQDLADLNIAHWQSYSDQQGILTVTRFPMLALSGGIDEDKAIVIGPRKLLYTPDADGKFYYVEHQGAAIEAGHKDILDLEAKMAEYGSQFLKKRPGSETATARALDSAEATSPLQDVVMRFEDVVNQALVLTAKWLKLQDEGAGFVEISKDYGPEMLEDGDLKSLIEARKNRDISRTAFINELKRRGIIDDEYDPEKDSAELEKEMMDSLARAQTMIDENPPPDKDEEDDDDNEA